MGPYMRPIPVGASAAMLFSLLVAFAISPWAARRLFRGARRRNARPRRGRAQPARRAVPEGDDAARLGRRRGARARSSSASSRRSSSRAIALVPLGVVHREDAAVRQQERVPGRRGPSRRHDARDDAPRALGDGGRPGARCRRSTGPRSTPARRRPTTSTASCVTTSCGRRRTRGTSRSSLAREGRAPPLLARHRPRRAPARSSRSPAGTTRASRSPRCRPGRRCCRRSSPRSTARTTRAAARWRGRCASVFSRRPRASSTSTGTSRARARRRSTASTARRRASPGSARRTSPRRCASPSSSRSRPARSTFPEIRERIPLRRHAARRAPARSRRARRAVGGGRRRPPRAALGDRTLRARAGRDVDLPQEPASRSST